MILPKLDLNVTNRCNLRCTHCAFNSGERILDEFSSNKIKQILLETKELGGQRIDITGGEPTLRTDLLKIITIAKNIGYKVELVTNGSLLDKDILKKLKSSNLDSIAISLDGSNYKIHSRIRNISKKTYNNILRAIKTAKKLGFVVKINTVIFQSNLNDITKITKFCIKNKLDEHGLYYFTPIGRGIDSKEKPVEPRAWLKFIRNKLVKFKGKIKLSLETPIIEKNKIKKEIGCIANSDRYHLQILPNGDVYPCAILASCSKPIANTYKKSINEIWQNKKLWTGYWKKISDSFSGLYCIKFNNFDIKKYNNFDLVCPLRKFLLEEAL